MKRALVLLVLAACDPIYSLEVHVHDPNGEPIADAALSATECDAQADDQSDLTDAKGVASIGGLGAGYPRCNITVAHVGFLPFESSFDEICHGRREDCDRVETIAVILEPNP